MFEKKLISIFLVLGLLACNTGGHRGTSDSIEDSKKRGTFIGEYELHSSDESINEITRDQVLEAFVEYGWFVTSDKPLIDTSYFNIGLRLSEKDGKILGGDFEQYQIGLDSGTLFPYHTIFTHHSRDGLTLMVWDPIPDTVAFKFYKGELPMGEILFIKKAE